MRRPCFFFVFFFVSFIFPLSSSQFADSPQNIETFFPFPVVFPSPPPPPPTNPSSPSSPPPPLQLPQRSSSSSRTVAKAVAATAACTFVVATFIFFFAHRYVRNRRSKKVGTDNAAGGGQPRPPVVLDNQFARVVGNLKGLIVDEDGLDALYWRKLEDENKNVIASFNKVVINSAREQEDDYDETVEARNGQRWKSEPVQEIPLLRGKSSTSHDKVAPGISEKPNLISQTLNPPPPPPPPPTPSVLIAAEQWSAPPPIPAKKNNSTPPPPPPVPAKKSNSISLPPPTVPSKKSNTMPPPIPPIPEKKNINTPPPPPLPKPAGLPTSSRSTVGKRMPPREESSNGEHNGNGQVKLKPLHWDKVNRNTDHSMVWDKIGGGSFRVDDDLMEALFGYVATNRKSPRKGETSETKNQNGSPPSQIAILDARKSQNIAIVLKSLGISHEEILDALTDGQGLSADTLEKLMRIAPTTEEISQILEFVGDISRLADAESFLFHLLKAVPTAFTRLNAMLFRQNYDSVILQFKESLQTLELGCKELRNRGLFMKLLEAILKAGNRMNAGTSRGNAQAFDLISLRKLSDVKSTDGKTTMLHFIVEEVVRVEGKRCLINRNHSLSGTSSSSINTSNLASKEEREKEYIMLGLPMVGGLSSEFSNVKKAAQIDYDGFAGTCSALKARIADVRQIALHRADNEEGGFGRVMKGFLEAAEEEIKVLKDEQMRIMELVQKTTEYYQAGASKNKGAHPLQLFVIIKDFLSMVDQVCIEIARNLQKKKGPSSKFGSSPMSPAARGVPVRFPNLPEHFMKEKSSSSSSESDTDF